MDATDTERRYSAEGKENRTVSATVGTNRAPNQPNLPYPSTPTSLRSQACPTLLSIQKGANQLNSGYPGSLEPSG
ncbi:hypothetical protein KI387_039680, partial [Taxus chinensis]